MDLELEAKLLIGMDVLEKNNAYDLPRYKAIMHESSKRSLKNGYFSQTYSIQLRNVGLPIVSFHFSNIPEYQNTLFINELHKKDFVDLEAKLKKIPWNGNILPVMEIIG